MSRRDRVGCYLTKVLHFKIVNSAGVFLKRNDLNSKTLSHGVHPSFPDILRDQTAGTILWNEPMRKHTTFGIGGPADALIIPCDETDLHKVLKVAFENDVPVTVIGNGSDLLVSDDGIEGIVIKISGCLGDVSINGTKVTAGAGCPLFKVTRICADAGMAGFEFAVGIPGTVGGAIVMNAGTVEMHIGDLVTRVNVIDFSGELIELDKCGYP